MVMKLQIWKQGKEDKVLKETELLNNWEVPA